MELLKLPHQQLLAAVIGSSLATLAAAEPARVAGDEVVVLATRLAQDSFDVPASIDRVDGSQWRGARLGVNLSEGLGAVPGLSIQGRQNYAQDLQISIRGFGARSSFGARGLRLYADGIPATMPDGQGQYSHFDLTGAERIEVLRGPFSALYGNSAGGVIAIFTAEAPVGGLSEITVDAGSLATHRIALRQGGESGGTNYMVDAAHFSTEGYRDHSRAERNTANARARFTLGARTTLVLVANAIGTPAVEDPLGLTAVQLGDRPEQAGTGALAYNTRKSLEQEQMGATLRSLVGASAELTVAAYGGHRHTTQFQAIPQAIEAQSATHPGGVIDLGRDFVGADAHLSEQRTIGGSTLTWTAGTSYDTLTEARRGYLNYSGSSLGVVGALRRDDANHVRSLDEYAQFEWVPTAPWHLSAGVRHSAVEVRSRDLLPSGGSASAVDYAATSPVAGVTVRIRPWLSLHGSYGHGFETPTLNDLAYGSTDPAHGGLNAALRPARSDNYEVGLKVQRIGLRGSLAAFYIRTRDELAVAANSGGRAIYENIGPTARRGIEASLQANLADQLTAAIAFTYLRAETLAAYVACSTTPCLLLPVPLGSRLPAVPPHAGYASLTWRAPGSGWSAGIETIGRSQIYADDRNLKAAAGYWSSNAHVTLAQSSGRWQLTETARIDNLFDRRYVGSVIVNESNGRYYEPSAGRTGYLLVSAGFR